MEFSTPRKKRLLIEEDDQLSTPKKRRTAPPTPPSHSSLPAQLSRLLSLHNALEQALSLGLATSSVGLAPSTPTTSRPATPTPKASTLAKQIPNVINHLGLEGLGLTRTCSVEDLSRLVWIWEWDGETIPRSSKSLAVVEQAPEDDNPFLVSSSKEWTRGGMGLIVTPTTHLSRSVGRRMPAYGIGIQVDAIGAKAGMAAVAKWTTGAESRRTTLLAKLTKWNELHIQNRIKHRETSRSSSPTPNAMHNVPFAGLPALTPLASPKPSSPFTKSLLSSPRKPRTGFGDGLFGPSTPTKGFAAPFPSTPSSSSSSRSGTPASTSRASLLSPFSTPTSKNRGSLHRDLGPQTPTTPRPQTPTTPRSQTAVEPETPTSSRRAALFERIRLKALASPSKGSVEVTSKNAQGEEVTRVFTGDEVKRRCLLGRLGGVAEAVWMLFSAPAQSPSSNPTPPTRRRRTIPIEEVVGMVVKSSRTPISEAEAIESLNLLTTLCPEFVKSIVIDKSQWLQMGNGSTSSSSPTKCPSNPGSRDWDPEAEVRKRKMGEGSPRKIAPMRTGGMMTLRDVRERIRKELDG